MKLGWILFIIFCICFLFAILFVILRKRNACQESFTYQGANAWLHGLKNKCESFSSHDIIPFTLHPFSTKPEQNLRNLISTDVFLDCGISLPCAKKTCGFYKGKGSLRQRISVHCVGSFIHPHLRDEGLEKETDVLLSNQSKVLQIEPVFRRASFLVFILRAFPSKTSKVFQVSNPIFDEPTDSKRVFQLNWEAQLLRALKYEKQYEKYRKALQQVEKTYSQKTETNYLVCCFEGLCALKTPSQKLWKLLRERTRDGTLAFKNGTSRLDISAHMANGLRLLYPVLHCDLPRLVFNSDLSPTQSLHSDFPFFITYLHNGSVCACIGNFDVKDDYAQRLRTTMAHCKADAQRRFKHRLTGKENVRIEILWPRSQWQKVKTLEGISPTYGVQIQNGKKKALFLPYVWATSGRSGDVLLQKLRKKGGILSDEPLTIYIFKSWRFSPFPAKDSTDNK